MAQYDIQSESCLGMSHSGAVYADGEGTIELSDDEVKTLVDLIREKKSTNVKDLGLEENHPELFKKLDEAYYDVAYTAEEMHWLWEGYYNNYYEYEEDELMDYCEKSCGFKFEGDNDDEYARSQAFNEWLDDYLTGLSDEDARRFFYDHMGVSMDMSDVEYTVGIPAAIIKMAEEK